MEWKKKIMDLGQWDKWVCFDVKKGYGREEDEILWPHHQKKAAFEKTPYTALGRWKALNLELHFLDLIFGQFHIGELTLLKNESCSNRIKMSLLM